MLTRDKLSQQVEKLIAEGQAVLDTQATSSNTKYVELMPFRKWVTSCENFVLRIGPAAEVWQKRFGAPIADHLFSTAQTVLAWLQSLKEAIDDDLLHRVEDLVMGDAFGSLLEQADELHSKGFTLAAGVLGRAVLEEHLRKLCDRHGCLPAGRPMINGLNQALYAANHIDKVASGYVAAMANVGNHCAHNLKPELSAADVRKFLDDVSGFLVRNPLP